ncbi:hypothetical protein DCC61_03095 [Candidatus Microgenomates bacterium]|nr:MAG: hypothetical protein DCC61_03095 [Candidatus Microgenomates bacterium]
MITKHILRLVVLIVATLYFTLPVSATSYYVSQSGNDNNSGSEGQPWQNLSKAFSTARAGDTVIVRGGTYTAPRTGWRFTNSGLQNQPITITNYPGEQVILHNPSMGTSGNYTIRCLASDPSVNYVTIKGTSLTTAQSIPNGPTSNKGIVLTGVNDAISPAIVAYRCDNWEVTGVDFINVAYAIFQRKVDYGATSADRWNVHHNRVYNFYRESGMQFNGNGNTITDNEIYKVSTQFNSTYGCQHLNLLGNNNVVRNNTISRRGSTYRCIGIFFEWDLADNNLVENNNISEVPVGISFFGGDNNIIRNNNISGTDVGVNITSHPDSVTAYPCNFSHFMPQANDTSNPDHAYYYPHDCRSKNNRIEGNHFSGFSTLLRQGPIQDSSNVMTDTISSQTPTSTSPSTLPSPSPIPGDLDGNGVINLLDFNRLIQFFGNPYTILDFNEILQNFGETNR